MVPLFAISNSVLARQTYSKRCHTAHAQTGEPLPLTLQNEGLKKSDVSSGITTGVISFYESCSYWG